MTNNHFSEISIRFANEFENELYRLSKKYRRIRADVEPIIIELQKGNFLGDRLQGFGEDYFIYKARVKNSNIRFENNEIKIGVNLQITIPIPTDLSVEGLDDLENNDSDFN